MSEILLISVDGRPSIDDLHNALDWYESQSTELEQRISKANSGFIKKNYSVNLSLKKPHKTSKPILKSVLLLIIKSASCI